MKDPAPHPGFPVSATSMLIAAARRHLKQVISGLVEPLGLTPHQFWALLLLREIGPQTLTDLASHMWLDHPTTSRLVHALQDLGYLSIQPHPQQGGEHQEKYEACSEKRAQPLFRGWGPHRHGVKEQRRVA